ncbi:MAG: bifunctional folylpolyglutamate synthase/dihydrofolate synthase [Anaeroplasmataceae bacterium]
MFLDINEAIEFIESRENKTKNRSKFRMDIAINKLNFNILSTKKIHIAGTNGKGSVSSLLSTSFIENNNTVIKLTSPYVISFNERIQINNKFITDEKLLFYANKLKDIYDFILNEYNEFLSFYESIFLITLMLVQDIRPDYLIVEVGIGGLNCPTNSIDYEVSIITNISFDHVDQLGNTIELIAEHKAGIIKSKNAVFTGTYNPQVIDIILSKCKINGSILTVVNKLEIQYLTPTNFMYKNIFYENGLIGFHQIDNSALAIEVLSFLRIPNDIIKKGLKKTYIPCRFEYINKTTIIDGAHNIDGINSLIKSINSLYDSKNIVIVFSCLNNKDSYGMIDSLDSLNSNLIFTSIVDTRKSDENLLFNYSSSKNKFVYNNYIDALNKALSMNKIVVLTGSLHFASIVRKYILNK